MRERALKHRPSFDPGEDLVTAPKPPAPSSSQISYELGRELRLTFSARDGAEWKRRVQAGEDLWAVATQIAALAGVIEQGAPTRASRRGLPSLEERLGLPETGTGGTDGR